MHLSKTLYQSGFPFMYNRFIFIYYPLKLLFYSIPWYIPFKHLDYRGLNEDDIMSPLTLQVSMKPNDVLQPLFTSQSFMYIPTARNLWCRSSPSYLPSTFGIHYWFLSNGLLFTLSKRYGHLWRHKRISFVYLGYMYQGLSWSSFSL